MVLGQRMAILFIIRNQSIYLYFLLAISNGVCIVLEEKQKWCPQGSDLKACHELILATVCDAARVS